MMLAAPFFCKQWENYGNHEKLGPNSIPLSASSNHCRASALTQEKETNIPPKSLWRLLQLPLDAAVAILTLFSYRSQAV